MPIDNVNPSSDDNSTTLLRKLLTGFVKGTFSIGSGGGVSQNVQAADGALVTIGSKADPLNNGSGSATAISLLKGIANTVSSQLMSVAVLNTATVIGNTGGFTGVSKQNPTISTSAYSSGFNVGGILTLPLFRGNGSTGVLESLTVVDRSAQAAPFTILLFDAALVGTVTDHATYTINASDTIKLVGQIVVGSSDYTTTSTVAVAVKSSLGIALKNNENTTNLYAVVVTTGTPTYAALALNFDLGLLQD